MKTEFSSAEEEEVSLGVCVCELCVQSSTISMSTDPGPVSLSFGKAAAWCIYFSVKMMNSSASLFVF